MSLESKLDNVLKVCNDLKVKLEVSIAYQKVQEKRITDHQTKIETLEAYRNNAIGRSSLIGGLCGVLGGGIVALIKFLSHG